MGNVYAMQQEGENVHIQIQSAISGQLKIDQSVAHNGVCLTVVDVLPDSNGTGGGIHTVTAIRETLLKTNLGEWLPAITKVNLERCLQANARIDGHFVQGHVDCTAICRQIIEANGSWYFTFQFAPAPDRLLVNKGSICIDGTSLTVVEADNTAGIFSVAIIPYTYQNTIFHTYKVGTSVNIEFDILGKYIATYANEKLKAMFGAVLDK